MEGINPKWAVAGAVVALAVLVATFWRSFVGNEMPKGPSAPPPGQATAEYSKQAHQAVMGRAGMGGMGAVAPNGGAPSTMPSQPGSVPQTGTTQGNGTGQ